MARRYVSRKTLHEAERRPRRRYAALSVKRGGAPVLAGRVQHPAIWFESNPWASDGDTGRCWSSDTDYTIYGVVDGVPSLIVYVTDGKVETVTFSVLLKPYQLDLATKAMRRAGLGRFVRPGLEEMRRQVQHCAKETPELRAYLRRVLTARGAARRRGPPRSRGTRS